MFQKSSLQNAVNVNVFQGLRFGTVSLSMVLEKETGD